MQLGNRQNTFSPRMYTDDKQAHKKYFPTSLALREMQVKTIMRYFEHTVQNDQNKKKIVTIPNAGRENESLILC